MSTSFFIVSLMILSGIIGVTSFILGAIKKNKLVIIIGIILVAIPVTIFIMYLNLLNSGPF